MGETAVMKHDPRPHIRRRGHAIDRLRNLTTGAALAGLAGTAGFGLLAAASWSGTATTANTLDGSTTTNDTTGGASGTTGGTNGTTGGANPTNPTPRATVAPNSGGSTQQTTPRVQRGSGSGHASTGGSH